METKQKMRWMGIAAVLATGLFAACGGGGGPTPTAGGTGLTATGVITGFGSIWVGGVEYETDGARIIANGDDLGALSQSELERALKVGMKVKVRGERNSDGVSGTAYEVEYDDELKGPVASVTDNGDGTKDLEILGQRAVVSQGGTNFDDDDDADFGFDALAAGQVVEASGFWKTDGGGNEYLDVTHIELKAPDMASYGEEIEIKGEIENLDDSDPARRVFGINGLTVDYTNADMDMEHAPHGMLEDGLLVEVRGDHYDGTTNTLSATRIEVEEHGLGRDIGRAEIEGYIDAGSLDGTIFSIGGQQVDFSGVTEWEHGGPGDLGDNVKVEAEGPIDGDGVMQADRIEFEGPGDHGGRGPDDSNGMT